MRSSSLLLTLALMVPVAAEAQDQAAALKSFDAEIRKYLNFSDKVKVAAANDMRKASKLEMYEALKTAHDYNEGMLMQVEAVAIPPALALYKTKLADARSTAANVIVARMRGYKAGMAFVDDNKTSQLSALGDHIKRSDTYAQRYNAAIAELRNAVARSQ